MEEATTVQELGALGFGLVIGWYAYYVNRYRTDAIQLGDLATFLGALGGAAVLSLFPAKSDLFGWYGIGLAVGFFAYFLLLLILMRMSGGTFTATWLLDGRAKKPTPEEIATGQHPMGRGSSGRG
jgi:hypothetical protein